VFSWVPSRPLRAPRNTVERNCRERLHRNDIKYRHRQPCPTIAFQGAPGAYSDHRLPARLFRDDNAACVAFEDAFAAGGDGTAGLAIIPIANSVAGRVPMSTPLMPGFRPVLLIGRAFFERVNHHLLVCPRAARQIAPVRIHVHALVAIAISCGHMCCSRRSVGPTTARHAAEIKTRRPETIAAIRLRTGRRDLVVSVSLQQASRCRTNTPVLCGRATPNAPPQGGPDRHDFVFNVRNMPRRSTRGSRAAALLRQTASTDQARKLHGRRPVPRRTQFLCRCRGAPDDRPLKLALAELAFFSKPRSRSLGVLYRPHKLRIERPAEEDRGGNSCRLLAQPRRRLRSRRRHSRCR